MQNNLEFVCSPMKFNNLNGKNNVGGFVCKPKSKNVENFETLQLPTSSPPMCPSTYKMEGNLCKKQVSQPISCPIGYERDNNLCKKTLIETPTCPKEYNLENNLCVQKPTPTPTEQITEAVKKNTLPVALILGIIILAIIIYLVLRMKHKKHHAHHEQHEHEKKHTHHKKQFQD